MTTFTISLPCDYQCPYHLKLVVKTLVATGSKLMSLLASMCIYCKPKYVNDFYT